MSDKEFIRILPLIKHKHLTIQMGRVTDKEYAQLSYLLLEIYFEEQQGLFIKTGRGGLVPIRYIREITFTK